MSAGAELTNPRGPPTEPQLAALRRFGAKPERIRGLTKEDAHDWIQFLVAKLQAEQEITDADTAGLPSYPEPEFKPASELPKPAPVAPPVSSPPAPAAAPVPPPQNGKVLWVQIGAWCPAPKVPLILKAFEEARKDAE